MKIDGEPSQVDVGVFVMSYHHGLLRMGVVSHIRTDEQGWTQCKVDWLEDDIYEYNKGWYEKIDPTKVYSNETRIDYLKPVNPQWLYNVIGSYGRYKNEQRNQSY